MNKKIIEGLSKYDFTYEKFFGYGHIDGYEVNIMAEPMRVYPVFLFSTYLPQDKKEEFVTKFNNLKIKYCKAAFFEFGVCFSIGSFTSGGYPKKIEEVMPKALEILNELEAPRGNICPGTNEELVDENSQMFRMGKDGIKVKLSNKAIEAYGAKIEKDDQDYADAPNNYLKGLLGIIIGGLAGAAVALLFGLLGYITWLAPFVSIFLGIYLYKKFGGKPTLMMVVMSFVVTLITVLGACFINEVIACTKACQEADFDLKGFEAISFVVEQSPEARSLLLRDFVVNALIIVFAEIYSIFDLRKAVRRVNKK